MRVLKDAYRGQRAAVIMGGTSLVDARFEYGRLREKGFVTFLESKALTPGLEMTFTIEPEKGEPIIKAIRLGRPTLEDVFIAKTGHRFEREEREH